jgi:hypothetical protein
MANDLRHGIRRFCHAGRVRVLALILVCAAAVAGCGSDDSSPKSGVSEADARTAARIQASAERRKQQSDELERQQEVDRLNAENAPALESEAEDTPAPPTAKPRSISKQLLSPADRASFDQLVSQLGGSSGIAVKAAGPGGEVQAAGELRSGAAWSTMKTGVAAASIAAGTAESSLLTRAITASDNAAADQLWRGLGEPSQAGARVSEQLRAYGDNNTQVQTQVVRSGFSSFGQSEWALADQARFTAGLPCSEPGKQVLALMGQVVGGQRWGLGSAGVPAAFKGGWGPGSNGGYLVRQMGILTIQNRLIAITIAALPADGSFDTGTRNLTQIASWAVSHINAKAAPRDISC